MIGLDREPYRALESENVRRTMSTKYFAYFLSLPERTLRALASVGGGIALLVLDTLVPQVIKGTTVYRILIGDGLRFVVERVAGITALVPDVSLPPLPHDYQARKLAGTALESLGLMAVQFSPLWVFAIAGDAAAGGKHFLRRLEEQLKHDGVIDPEFMIDGVVDLLDTMQRASRATAITIDTPPLSRNDLESMSAELRAAYLNVFEGSVNLLPRLDRLWSRMLQASIESRIPLPQLAGYMAQSSQAWLGKGKGALRALGRTGSDLAGEQILSGYQRALDELASGGARAFLRVRISPYLQAAQRQFAPEFQSWTEAGIARAVAWSRSARE
jgi:hypothetical protein